MQKTLSRSVSQLIGTWQKKMFWLMWVTYASFYLCRVNISIAMPKIMEEFSLTKTDMGLVLSSLFLLYAIGQFINGQLGDKLNSKRIITLGLLSSAVMNIVFGFSGGILGLMVVIWGLNGYFQAMGWGPTVKSMANWFPAEVRGKISGRLSTSYIIGGAISWLLAAIVAGWASDRIFKHRRAPVAFIMLFLLAIFCYFYKVVPGNNWVVSLIILLFIGFFTFGPHSLIVTAIPADLGSRKAASSVTGFVDAMGYAGASLTGLGTGYLIENFGWNAAFYFWIFGAIFAAIMTLFIWNYKERGVESVIMQRAPGTGS